MSTETLEVGAVILAAIAVAIFAIRLAWGVIEELIDEGRDEKKRRAAEEASRRAPFEASLAKVEEMQEAGWPTYRAPAPTRSVEPVRQSFRAMLEGGPDYRG